MQQLKLNNSADKSFILLIDSIAQLNVLDIYKWMNIIKQMVFTWYHATDTPKSRTDFISRALLKAKSWP